MEVERARLTRRVVDKLEAEGKLDKACEMIMEMQVETYGSMEISEKVNSKIYHFYNTNLPFFFLFVLSFFNKY